MKILLWPSQYLPNIGGIEVMTHCLALQLKQTGHEVQVISSSSAPDEFKEFSLDGIPVFTFPFTSSLLHYNLSSIKKILTQIEQVIEAFKPDIAHIHGWFETFCFYQVRTFQKNKIPFCISIHGLLEQLHYQTAACQKLWCMASAISTVSHALIESLKQQGIAHSSLQTIYNGLPLPSSPTKPLLINPPKLVMVGRLSEEKCFSIAFHALKILIPKYPQLTLCLVGGGGEYQELSRLKRFLSLDASIEMTDFVKPECVGEYIEQASILLVPSYYEAFCLTALEAAMRGRPVIASNVYGLKEVVEHEITGFLIEPKDPIALACAIDHLLSHPEKMQQMGQNAKMRAMRLFSIETATQNYLAMYKKIQSPLVSVVVAAHNGEKYLKEAIQSVLAQDYPNYEIWVVDNGSTDNTNELVRSFAQIHYKYLEKADTALARNEGILLSKGKYIAFLDQDDTWPSDKLNKQVQFLESNPQYGAVIGLQRMYLEPGCQKPHWLKQTFLERAELAYLPSALMIRKETLDATSHFNAAFPIASDVAWFFKAQHQGIQIGIIHEILVHRRIHGENTSNKYLELQKEILSVIKTSLVERRHG